MSDLPESAPVIDLADERTNRRHDIREARLLKVRGAFEKAFPLPVTPVKKRSKPKKSKKRR